MEWSGRVIFEVMNSCCTVYYFRFRRRPMTLWGSDVQFDLSLEKEHTIIVILRFFTIEKTVKTGTNRVFLDR
jgi:hypothetical protein